MRFRPFVLLAILVAGFGAAGGWWVMHSRDAEAQSVAAAQDGKLERQLSDAGIDARQRGAIEALVRATILDHPEILPEAMDKLQARETASRLAPLRGAIETPFPGAVLGNPAGKVTLVEFTDFACTYCRSSVPDVEALLSANPDLRVVVRQLPIIAPESEPAARMGLAAAAQGKYAAFHKAMFTGERPSATSIAAAARVAGLETNRVITAVAGTPVGLAPRQGSWDRVWRLQAALEQTAATTGSAALTLADGRILTVPGAPSCAVRFLLDDGQGDAQATRTQIRVGRETLARLGGDEPMIAALLAHELAHAALDHETWLASAPRTTQRVRRTEREADRLSVWILANAGYDPQAAVRMIGQLEPRRLFGIAEPSHGSARARAGEMATESAVLRAQPDADWATRFRREN